MHHEIWLFFSAVLIAGIVPCGWICLASKELGRRLVALELSSIVIILSILLMGKGYSFSALADVALTSVVLSIAGVLVLTYLIERWL